MTERICQSCGVATVRAGRRYCSRACYRQSVESPPRGCEHPGCVNLGKSRGLCDTHRWQMNNYGEMWDVGARRPSLTDAQVDGALLLIVRGSTTDEIAELMGIASGKSLTSHLRKRAARGLRDALSARSALPHGTRGRYQRGCRCSDCKRANRESKRADQSTALTQRSRSRTRDEHNWLRSIHMREQHEYLLLGAHHWGQQWTGPEIETALARRSDDSGWLRTAAEVAEITGRTVPGVTYIRRKRAEPKVAFHL